MVLVTFTVGYLRHENSIEGLSDLIDFPLTSNCLHHEHRIDKNGLVKELISLHGNLVMNHLCKHLKCQVRTLISCLVQASRKQSVDKSHAVQAILAIVILTNLYILRTYGINLECTLVRFWFDIVGLYQVLVILGHQRVITAEAS